MNRGSVKPIDTNLMRSVSVTIRDAVEYAEPTVMSVQYSPRAKGSGQSCPAALTVPVLTLAVLTASPARS